MAKKALFGEENMLRMVQQLNDFAVICGVKNVSRTIDNNVFLLHHTEHFVLYTQTTLKIELTIKNSVHKPNRPCKERTFSVYFHKVMLPHLEQFDMLKPLVRYVDLSEDKNMMVLRFHASHFVDMFNEKNFNITIGEHQWDRTGVKLYMPDIATKQLFSSLEEQNNHDFTNKFAEKVFNHFINFVTQPREYWESLEKGNNDFKPNIINDLKHGGSY